MVLAAKNHIKTKQLNPSRTGRYFAVIDIGSNSIKISVAKLHQKTYSILIEEKEKLRLLKSDEQSISPKSLKQLIKVLRGFLKIMKDFPCKVRVIATSAMRRAKNRQSILSSIEKETGLNVEVISGEQEGEYVVLASKFRFPLETGSHWVMDIGGGSVEFSFLKDGKLLQNSSIPMGAVFIKGNYFEKNEYSTGAIQKVLDDLSNKIERCLAFHSFDKILISGGSPAAIAKIIQVRKNDFDHPLHGMEINSSDLYRLTEKILQGGNERLVQKYGISKGRSDLVMPAICIIQAFFHFVAGKTYVVSRTGLREGVICSEL